MSIHNRILPCLSNRLLVRPRRGGWAARSLHGFVCAVFAVVTGTANTFEANWHQWRGPMANGVAPSAKPPLEWSETKNIKWKAKIPGYGNSSPIVWNDSVFVLTAVGTGKKPEGQAAPARSGGGGGRGVGGEPPTEVHQFVVMCLDRATGKVRWQKVAREEFPHEGFRANDGSFASTSPITDGEHVYAYFGSRGLFCYDMQGNLKWSEDFGDMTIKLTFGEGSSPALHGNTIVVQWDHEGGSFIQALDKKTGARLWRTPREEATSWATPLIVPSGPGFEVVTAATSRVRSYDLATGALKWESDGLTANTIPSPVLRAGIVYVMSGFRGSALHAIRLGRTGNLSGTDAIVWKYNRSTPYVPSPLLYGDKLYFLSSNNGILSCLDADDGAVLTDAERIPGMEQQMVYASPVGADDRVYLVSRTGTCVVLKNTGKLDILATNKLSEGIDASPALVGGEVFLRGRESVYCIAQN